MAQDLTNIFNKFVGKEVIPPTSFKIDPTLSEMSQVAQANGLKLRVMYPGMAGSMEFDDSRANTYIEQQNDGKYRVSNRFNLG